METRWNRFRAPGPPPSPVADQAIAVRIRGSDSARIVLDMRSLQIADLVSPFSDEIHFGERVGVIGPNGSGKSALMHVLAGAREPDGGELRVGPRVSTGFFTQLQSRADFSGQVVLDIVMIQRGELQAAMAALARYGLAEAARRRYDVLSGGEKARLEVLILELEGHNLLLLDEPTDNLDTDSSEALETALDGFVGTVVAVSHDRAFLSHAGPLPHGPARRRGAVVPGLRAGARGADRPGPRGRRPPGQAALVLVRGGQQLIVHRAVPAEPVHERHHHRLQHAVALRQRTGGDARLIALAAAWRVPPRPDR